VNARGFILQPSYRLERGRPVLRLLGRLESGEPFLVEDDRFRPYFFVRESDASVLRDRRDARLAPCDLRDLAGEPVLRVETDEPGRVPELRAVLEAQGRSALEADVRFAYRYLIDHGIRSALEIRGEPRALGSGVLAFRNPELVPCELRPALRVVSLDIETQPDASRLFSCALVGAGIDQVWMVSKDPVAGAEAVPDERALLEALCARVRQLDPDVVTGWNVVDFDLRVLLRRAGALGVPLALGTMSGPVRLQRDLGFTRQSRAEVPGRQVLDAQGLVRDAFIPLADYRLETAARQILGRGKKIEGEGLERARAIERLYRDDRPALAEYNREDARIVLEIVEREALVELCVERSLLSGMQLDRVGASIASFDLLYLPELRRRGIAAPSVDTGRKQTRVQGGAVLDSHPGLYSNVAVFDFKSLYPSLMRTFNLDPLAFARPGEDPIRAPNGATFARERAILPEVLERFAAGRERAKRRGDRHADLAIKIMMNALFGVLGAGACRFFSPEVANAITGFGQQTLHWSREAFLERGIRVLYGDTDSIFVGLDPGASPEAARAQAEELRAQVQERIAGRVRAQYRVEPALELELECVYQRFFQPSVRGGAQGSKKRYAGWLDGEVVVVGLEAVRRDWPRAAKRLQLGMLERVFRAVPVVPFVREQAEALRAGKLDRELVIRKAIRKGSLDRYTARAAPHVAAARKLRGSPGREIRYVITLAGPEPVLSERALPGPIDRDHYLEHVFRPIADAILRHVDSSFDEALGRPRQLSLL
jgi:DNA polymerase-2